MVDMCMTQYEIVNFRGIKTQVTVHCIGLETLALIHTAVEQNLQPTFGRYHVFASRHLAGGTHKLQFHVVVFLKVQKYEKKLYLVKKLINNHFSRPRTADRHHIDSRRQSKQHRGTYGTGRIHSTATGIVDGHIFTFRASNRKHLSIHRDAPFRKLRSGYPYPIVEKSRERHVACYRHLPWIGI